MVAFLAALPAIFAAIKGARDIFDLGKKVVEDVTGEAVDVRSSDQLRQHIESLPEEQQQAFVDQMQAELKAYDAVSNRLMQQGGRLDPETLTALSAEKRGKIAFLRMTTRPWAVRWMVVAVVFPPLVSVFSNLAIALFNILNDAFHWGHDALGFIEFKGVLNDLYLSMVGWASGVIMTYMGMREIGKAVGHDDHASLADVKKSAKDFLGSLRAVFQ
jgi:hypothetical protein